MVYKGHIENGVVVLDESVSLPEGTQVQVEPVETENIPTLAEQFKDIIGIIDDLPEDFAEQHDHYIHGTPKR
jgi:predicted DNA-binding antitoxin AbrB/MazE fold protein